MSSGAAKTRAVASISSSESSTVASLMDDEDDFVAVAFFFLGGDDVGLTPPANCFIALSSSRPRLFPDTAILSSSIIPLPAPWRLATILAASCSSRLRSWRNDDMMLLNDRILLRGCLPPHCDASLAVMLCSLLLILFVAFAELELGRFSFVHSTSCRFLLRNM